MMTHANSDSAERSEPAPIARVGSVDLLGCLTELLQKRCVVHMYKNLDGTFTISANTHNPRRRARKAVKRRGNNLSNVIAEAAEELKSSIEACDMIP